MRLVGKEKLQALLKAGTGRAWIQAWVEELSNAHWKQPEDVRNQFPNVHQIGVNEFMFPIERSGSTVHLQIAFPQGIALIKDLK